MKTPRLKGQTALGTWKAPKTVVVRKKKPPVDMASDFLRRRGLKTA